MKNLVLIAISMFLFGALNAQTATEATPKSETIKIQQAKVSPQKVELASEQIKTVSQTKKVDGVAPAATKHACAPGCTKACCAKADKKACAPGCTKACCAEASKSGAKPHCTKAQKKACTKAQKKACTGHKGGDTKASTEHPH